jgi:hypothetical protein
MTIFEHDNIGFMYIGAVACNIGNSLNMIVRQLDCLNLISIEINCDPISNKGFKRLLGIRMPHFCQLSITNTNVTIDVLKTLKKNMMKYRFVGFYRQSKLITMTYLKEVITMIGHHESNALWINS